MRGKGLSELAHTKKARITPACAGKTTSVLPSTLPATDHPRVCGENPCRPLAHRQPSGSPPRVRGKRDHPVEQTDKGRITPACAGKTVRGANSSMSRPNHPRVCGENGDISPLTAAVTGSPPRVRGKPGLPDSTLRRPGITPAHAGKTQLRPFIELKVWDHPRVCGENLDKAMMKAAKGGSPPRVRGKLSRR